MAQSQPAIRLPDVTYSISNTGPLISAFQSDSFPLLTQIFAQIHISPVCAAELTKHGWGQELQTFSPKLIVVTLTPEEKQRAGALARQIALHPNTNDPVIENHLGEAQVIVLSLRNEYRDDILLLDELAARAFARQEGARLSGFPGALLLAVQAGLITANDLKARLEKCRVLGTHYSATFIQHVYEMARQGRRQ